MQTCLKDTGFYCRFYTVHAQYVIVRGGSLCLCTKSKENECEASTCFFNEQIS